MELISSPKTSQSSDMSQSPLLHLPSHVRPLIYRHMTSIESLSASAQTCKLLLSEIHDFLHPNFKDQKPLNDKTTLTKADLFTSLVAEVSHDEKIKLAILLNPSVSKPLFYDYFNAIREQYKQEVLNNNKPHLEKLNSSPKVYRIPSPISRKPSNADLMETPQIEISSFERLPQLPNNDQSNQSKSYPRLPSIDELKNIAPIEKQEKMNQVADAQVPVIEPSPRTLPKSNSDPEHYKQSVTSEPEDTRTDQEKIDELLEELWEAHFREGGLGSHNHLGPVYKSSIK